MKYNYDVYFSLRMMQVVYLILSELELLLIEA